MLRSCSLAILLVLAGCLSTAQALDLVDQNETTIGWASAAGPVYLYGVFVSRNSEEIPAEPEQLVAQNFVTVGGEFGDSLVVRVAAYDDYGHRSPLSEPMEEINFIEGTPIPAEDPPSTVFFSEDFEDYGPGEDPAGWYDSAKFDSFDEDPSLFSTFELDDGTMAFGTTSEEPRIHSHLVLGDSSTWSGYEVSGATFFGNNWAGVGVTIYSGYPSSDGYYSLRRGSRKEFRITHAQGQKLVCQGNKKSGVNPETDVWYEYRFQAFAEGANTRLRAKGWRSDSAEPLDWPIDCIEENASLEAGTIGLWSRGKGLKLWDDINVIAAEY